MTKSTAIAGLSAAALMGIIGKTVAQLGQWDTIITGKRTVSVSVQVRGRAPRGQAKALQFRAFGLYTDGREPTLCAGAWQPTENEALRSLVVDFEQSNLPRVGEAISIDLHAGQGRYAVPDQGRYIDYRDPPELALAA